MKKHYEKLLTKLIDKIKKIDPGMSPSDVDELLLLSMTHIAKVRPNLNHPANPLSITEMLCMILLANGYSPEKSADMLGISAKSVKTYEQRIRYKLGAKNRTHAFYLALTGGFISLIDS